LTDTFIFNQTLSPEFALRNRPGLVKRIDIFRAIELNGPQVFSPKILERDEEKWEPVFRPHPALNY
jgi:hypothetical protein